MVISTKKAQNTASLALCLSLVFFIVTLFLGAYWRVMAVNILSWQILSSALVWLLLLIHFYHRRQAEQEKLDVSRMSTALQQDTIFSGGANKAALFEQAQKRLAFFEKWILPIAGVLIAIYQIIIGYLVYQKVIGLVEWKLQNPLLSAILMSLISFICFMISRYATGMSSEPAWRPLRAGGSYLLATAFLGFFAFIALLFAQYKKMAGLTVLEYVIPWLMIVLGVEILINTIFDIYRPRVSGQYSQSSIDSRLLGLINEPGGLFHTMASAIDYQFGFHVSETWFYKLLEKAILPLLFFAALMLYLMTTIVIVGPGQMCVIEHLGNAKPEMGGRLAVSGVTFKWPWPFDKTYMYSTNLVQKVDIGFEEEDGKDQQKQFLLWGKEHYKSEYDLLVAYSGQSSQDKQETIPVSIVRANIPVLYRIKNISDYIYNHSNTPQMLEAICYRELVKYGASATIETDENSVETSLLGRGRLEASNILLNRIQDAADRSGLGVEIVLCGLQGIHPSPKLAEDYQNVIASVQSRQTRVLDAMAERNKKLTELAGSIEQVNTLYDQVIEYNKMKDTMSPEQDAQMRKKLASSLEQSQGKVFKAIREAQSQAFEKASIAHAAGMRFQGQLKAYQANPEIYKRIERLRALEETLDKIRKYVVVGDSKDSQVYIIDLQEQMASDLLNFGEAINAVENK